MFMFAYFQSVPAPHSAYIWFDLYNVTQSHKCNHTELLHLAMGIEPAQMSLSKPAQVLLHFWSLIRGVLNVVHGWKVAVHNQHKCALWIFRGESSTLLSSTNLYVPCLAE